VPRVRRQCTFSGVCTAVLLTTSLAACKQCGFVASLAGMNVSCTAQVVFGHHQLAVTRCT
jgi:hypothetical protein